MAKMFVLQIIFVIMIDYISFINPALLNDCNSNIYPNGGNNDIIVCTNKCNECNIFCDSKDQCKGSIKVFSAALVTNIHCTNYNSCEGLNLYLGYNNNYNYPNQYNIDNFTSIYDSVNIYCTGNIACKAARFYITGNYINGTYIDVSGNIDNFQDSRLECDLFEHQSCQLKCGNSDRTCKNARFTCFGGICTCIGSGCKKLWTGGIDMRS